MKYKEGPEGGAPESLLSMSPERPHYATGFKPFNPGVQCIPSSKNIN